MREEDTLSDRKRLKKTEREGESRKRQTLDRNKNGRCSIFS